MKRLFRRIPASVWPTLGFLALTVAFLSASISLDSTSGRIPRFVIGLTLVLLLLQGLFDFIDSMKIRQSGKTTREISKGSRDSQRSVALSKLLTTLAWISALPPLLWLAGFVLGVALYCTVYLRWHADESWPFSIAFAAALGVSMQLLFVVLLQAQLYPGFIFSVFS